MSDSEERRIVIPDLFDVMQIGPFPVRPIKVRREVDGERRIVIVAFEASEPPFQPFTFQEDKGLAGQDNDQEGFRCDSRVAFVSYPGGVIVGRPRDPLQWVPALEAPRMVERIRFGQPRIARKGDKLVWVARLDPLNPFDLLFTDEWLDAKEHIRKVSWRRAEDGRIIGQELNTGMTVFPDRNKVPGDYEFEFGLWQEWNLSVPERGGALLAWPLPGNAQGSRKAGRGEGMVRQKSTEELIADGYYTDEQLRHIQYGRRWVDVYKVLGLEPGCDLKAARAAYKAKATGSSVDVLVGKYQQAIEAQTKALDGVVADSGNDMLKVAWVAAQADKPFSPESEFGRVVEAMDDGVLNNVLKGRVRKHIRRVEAAREEYQKASGLGLQDAGKYQALIKAAFDRVKLVIKGRPKDSIMIKDLAREVKQRPLDIQWCAWVFAGRMVSGDGTAIVKEMADKIREYYKNKRMPVGEEMSFTDLAGYCGEALEHTDKGEGGKEKPTTAWAVPVIVSRGWGSYIVPDGKGNPTVPDFVVRMLFWAFENEKNRKLKNESGPEFKLWQVVERVNYECGTDLTVSQAEAILAHREVDLPTEEAAAGYAFNKGRVQGVYEILLNFAKELATEHTEEGAVGILPVRVLPGNETIVNLAARLTAYNGHDVLCDHVGAYLGRVVKQDELLTPAQVQAVLVEVTRSRMKRRADIKITVEELALAEGVTEEQIRAIASEIQPATPVTSEKLKTEVEVTGTGNVRLKVGALMRQAERKRAQNGMVRVIGEDNTIAGGYVRQIVETLRERHSEEMPEMVVIEEITEEDLAAAEQVGVGNDDGIEPAPSPAVVLVEEAATSGAPSPIPPDAQQ